MVRGWLGVGSGLGRGGEGGGGGAPHLFWSDERLLREAFDVGCLELLLGEDFKGAEAMLTRLHRGP